MILNLFNNYFNKIKNRIKPPTKLFIFLISITILAHLLALITSVLTDGALWTFGEYTIKQKQLFMLSLDGGYFEYFQYILLLWCGILSSIIFFKQNKETFSIPLIYIFLFIDDSLSFHDYIITNYLMTILDKTFIGNQIILRTKDFAEYAYWFIVFLIILFISYKQFFKASNISKSFLKTNYAFLLLLSFFSIFIDTINSNISRWFNIFGPYSKTYIFLNPLRIFINLAEEIGEIAVIAMICAWLFQICNTKSIYLNKRKKV